MTDPVRIALIGPESSGKSSIATRLADHFGYVLVEEYAREYLARINRPYTLNDILLIYRHQFAAEQQCFALGTSGIIVDTECINGKVWCEEQFSSSPEWFTQMIETSPYDLYLLTSPDIPWVADPLRENPGKGHYFFERYKQELELFNLNYAVVSGLDAQRFTAAVKAVEEYLQKRSIGSEGNIT